MAQLTGKRYLPNIIVTLRMPAMLDPQGSSRSRVNKVQRDAVVAGLSFALSQYHRKYIPLHFNRSRQKKYRFKRRSPRTIRRKRRRGIADWHLVESRRTKSKIIGQMEGPRRVRMPSGIGVLGVMRWPSGMVDNPKGVTMKDMADEIRQMTPDEVNQVMRWTNMGYFKFLDKELSKQRVKRLNLSSPAPYGTFQTT